MKYMTLIALIMVISVHMLKVGFFVFLLLVACVSENSMAHEHDHHDDDWEKSKYVHHKTLFRK